jgi:hypothetical protein
MSKKAIINLFSSTRCAQREHHRLTLSVETSHCSYYTEIIDFTCVNKALDTVTEQVVLCKSACDQCLHGTAVLEAAGQEPYRCTQAGCVGNDSILLPGPFVRVEGNEHT